MQQVVETKDVISSGLGSVVTPTPHDTDTLGNMRSRAGHVADNADAANNMDFEKIHDMGGTISAGRKFLGEAASTSIKEVVLLPAAGIEPILEAADSVQQMAGEYAEQKNPEQEHRKEAAPRGPSTH